MGIYKGAHSLALSAKSAYHQAVDGGYLGSEEEFNEALANFGNAQIVQASDVVFDGTATGMEATDAQSAIEELFTDVSDGKRLVASAITDKGVETAQDATYAQMAENIAAIETGIDTSDATASAENIDSGKTAYVNGAKITGTSTKVDTSDASATAANIDSGKTAYVNGNKVTGTSTKIDTSGATASAADLRLGKTAYVAGGSITGTMPAVAVSTPSISVSTGGLVTATVEQGAGDCAGGTKTATQQLTAKAAQTYTPGTTAQSIASGQYLTGAQTIQGDSNLVAGNIKNGVSIFGVSGTVKEDVKTAASLKITNVSDKVIVVYYQTAGGTMGYARMNVGGSSTVSTYVGAMMYAYPYDNAAQVFISSGPGVTCYGGDISSCCIVEQTSAEVELDASSGASVTKCRLTVTNQSRNYACYILFQTAPMGSVEVYSVDVQDSTTITSYVGGIVSFVEDTGSGYAFISRCVSGCSHLVGGSVLDTGILLTASTASVNINVDVV